MNTVFQLLPSRKRYPEYFEVINDPMDLKMVAEKIQKSPLAELLQQTVRTENCVQEEAKNGYFAIYLIKNREK